MAVSWFRRGTDALITLTAAALVIMGGKLLADSFNRELLTDTRI